MVWSRVSVWQLNKAGNEGEKRRSSLSNFQSLESFAARSLSFRGKEMPVRKGAESAERGPLSGKESSVCSGLQCENRRGMTAA